jgi:diadenylate cyclase
VVARDERVQAMLEKIAPGTELRRGIDRIIQAGMGAIIVLGHNSQVDSLLSGGFKLSTKFTAQRLSEVAKMDGAIVVDDEATNILFANVQLVPDPSIQTQETGTRHRTAERVGRQTAEPVVSVSESMQIVSIYVDDIKHVIEDTPSILFRANQALSTLERYRTRLDEVSSSLSALEVEDMVGLRDVLNVLQRAEMVRRIAGEVEQHVGELGTDGRLLQLQLDELVSGIENERVLTLKDYMPDARHKPAPLLRELDTLAQSELLDLTRLAETVGFDVEDGSLDQPVSPRGYRQLSQIPRLPERTVQRLVTAFGSVQGLMKASMDDLVAVEGVGNSRARAIQEGLTRMAQTSVMERYS